MPLLHPGDTFPPLTLGIPGAQAIQVPGWLAGEFGVVLFNRGAWCPYCLQSTGFVLDPQGKVIVSVYSSGAIGRLVPEDVIGLVRYLREHAAAAS